jgi:hypothetical protein
MKGSSMASLISKFTENMFYADDRNWTEERFLTADPCLVDPNYSDGDPYCIFKRPVAFDQAALAAYREWEDSFSYFLKGMDGRH